MMLLMIGTLRVATNPRRMAVYSMFDELFMFTFPGIFPLVYFIAWHDVADDRDLCASTNPRRMAVFSAFHLLFGLTFLGIFTYRWE